MGLDEIHPRVLRELVEELAKPFSLICQKSWSTGEVSDDWRFANVMPIYKKDQKVDLGNYRKIAACDEEIQHLYEEMEQQIKKEKERFLLKLSFCYRLQSYSQDLECKLLSKEQELEQLVQNQKRLNQQCTELLSSKEQTKVENTKLKLTNQELLGDLERTSHELSLTQEQLHMLHEEKEMEVYRVTETLQREKSGLLKQLDFLSHVSFYLLNAVGMKAVNHNEQQELISKKYSVFLQKCKTSGPKASRKLSSVSVIEKYIEGRMLPNSHSFEEDDDFINSKRRNSTGLSGILSVDPGAGATGGLSKVSQLQRIVSIEEDHLPQLLDRLVNKQLNRWTGEDENTSEMEMDKKRTEQSMEHSPSSSREQPVGKEALSNVRGQRGPHHEYSFKTRKIGEATAFIEQLETNACSYLEERINSVPDHLFKVIFVGNSSVGKTSFLRFCEDCFLPGTAATVGVDYNVKTITVDNTWVALQLWDMAGQERYRSITKKFFGKADGVIVMYDITAKNTFTAVKQWLISIEEATEENVPVLLLGNKTNNEKECEVPMGMAEHLAKDSQEEIPVLPGIISIPQVLIYFLPYPNSIVQTPLVCHSSISEQSQEPHQSSSAGSNRRELITEIQSFVVWILMELEDKVKEKTIELQSDMNEKSCCIKP
ncbi:LOW QUALITY PROTEIN: EF-hand calcium-binding domain-containing protein 4B [Leptosomus discolor]